MTEKRRQYLERYNEINKERIKERKAIWREANRQSLREKSKEYTQSKKQWLAEGVNRRRAKARKNLVQFLGGSCSHCGIDDYRVLELDHINGDGYLKRVQGKTGFSVTRFRQFLKNPNVRDILQVLCGNCHNIKTFENEEFKRRTPRP